MRCGLPWRREWKTQITLFIYGTIHHWLFAQRNTISLAVLESQTFDCEYKDVEKYNNKIKCKANDEQHKEKRNVQQIHYYHSCESIVRRVGFACYLILFAMMTVCRWSERQRRRCSEVVRQMNGFAHHAVEWWDERIATEHNDVILCYVFAILNCIEFIWVGTVFNYGTIWTWRCLKLKRNICLPSPINWFRLFLLLLSTFWTEINFESPLYGAQLLRNFNSKRYSIYLPKVEQIPHGKWQINLISVSNCSKCVAVASVRVSAFSPLIRLFITQ